MDEAGSSARGGQPHASDALLVIGLGAVTLLEYTRDRSPSALEMIAAAAAVLSLLVRRRHPVPVTGVVSAATVVLLVTATPALAPNVAMLVAAYSGVVHAGGSAALVTVCVLSALGWSTGMALSPDPELGNRVVSAAWIAVPLGIGGVVRAQVRRAASAERRTVEAVAVLAQERDRIAREMHDVVAHGLAVVVLHARGGREALRHGDEAGASDAFGVVEEASRQALAEMRRLVALIRTPQDADAPSPTLTYLEDLVDSVRAAGLRVDLEVEGERAGLPAGVDAAAYRVVQEALTNVIRHAHGAAASVRVRVGGSAVELEVEDDGPGASSGTPGHGLVGMAERVAVYSGQFASGPRADGGFRVWALLPLGPS